MRFYGHKPKAVESQTFENLAVVNVLCVSTVTNSYAELQEHGFIALAEVA